MNKSYSKLRHIQNTNLLLECKHLNEGRLLQKLVKNDYDFFKSKLTEEGINQLEDFFNRIMTRQNIVVDGDNIQIITNIGNIPIEEVINRIAYVLDGGGILSIDYKYELPDKTRLYIEIDDILNNYKIGEAPSDSVDYSDDYIFDLDDILKLMKNTGRESFDDSKKGEYRDIPRGDSETGWYNINGGSSRSSLSETKSIWNWDLYHKIRKTPNVITNKIIKLI